jgi:hemerythrin superfamily protein
MMPIVHRMEMLSTNPRMRRRTPSAITTYALSIDPRDCCHGDTHERVEANGTLAAMTSIDLGRPVQGDVVDLILDDHRRFEALLREMRDSSADRDAVRRAFAALHVAHALAEERVVYPKLRRKDAISEHDEEHGHEEHAEGNEALLAVLELKGTGTDAFDEAVEKLSAVINHHLTEEEQSILNPAREEVSDRLRTDLGKAFADARNSHLDDDCGSIEQVRALVAEAERSGLLDDD